MVGIASIAVILAGATTYNVFMSPEATLSLEQNVSNEGADGDGETNDDYTAEGANGDGDGETDDDVESQQ